MYRYGDGSPFPFEENFIDIVVAAVDACTATFAAAAQLEQQRVKARDARREADEEGRRLTALERSLEGAASVAGASLAKDATLSQQTAQRALDAARHSIVAARAMLEKRVAAAMAEPRVDRALATSFGAMARFFEHHLLPRTTWDWKWTHGEGAEATAQAGRFSTTFDLSEAPWSSPPRIGALVPDLVVQLPKKRVLGRPAPAKVSLERAGLVSVQRSGGVIVLGVREHASKPSGGWRLMFEPGALATGTPLDAAGKPIGDELELHSDTSARLMRLVEVVVAAMDDAVARRRAREIVINKAELRTMSDPADSGKALLDLLTPTIRALCAKSRVPGELVLKRDVVDGRREELYVPRQSIAARFASLPADYKKLFDAAGLGQAPPRDATEVDSEDVTTDQRGPQPARPMPPPPPPAAIRTVPAAAPNMPTLMVPAA